MMNTTLIQFKTHGDKEGFLISLENNSNIPFSVERMFYIFNANGTAVRGKHANKNSSFLMICLSGKCTIKIKNRSEEKFFLLNKPNIGLYIPRMVWKEMYDFSSDAVLVVLSDKKYDPNEYIYSYDEYLHEVEDDKE